MAVFRFLHSNASCQALFTPDFGTAANALPTPPSSSATASSTFNGCDYDDHDMQQFARNSLGDIVRECVSACGRAGLKQGHGNSDSDSNAGGQDDADSASKVFVRKLFSWVVLAQQSRWIDDASAQAYLKMLWGVGDHAGDSSGGIDSVPAAPLPPSSNPSSASFQISQPAALQAYLRAAAGDVHGVISAAEAMHCRCVNCLKSLPHSTLSRAFFFVNVTILQ